MEERRTEDRDYVNSLARGLRVIRAFKRSKPNMTLSEVAVASEMNRAAVRRLLLTLVREGYAETDGKYFRLKPRILELGFAALSSVTVSEIAQPIVDRTADVLDEMCLVGVLDGSWVVYTNCSLTRRVISVNLDVGSRLPAAVMSTGRVLLAAMNDKDLDEWIRRAKLPKYTTKTTTSKKQLRAAVETARKNGWSIMDEEYEVGFRSLSVPVLDREGHTIAALNVCCPSPRVTIEKMIEDFLPKLTAAAHEITASIPRLHSWNSDEAIRWNNARMR
jgi:IclR family pca regulon transcriptional regulator